MAITRNNILVKLVAVMFLQGVKSTLSRYELVTDNENVDELTSALLTTTKTCLLACIVNCDMTPDCRYLYYSEKSQECILHSKRKVVLQDIKLWRYENARDRTRNRYSKWQHLTTPCIVTCLRRDYYYDDNTEMCLKKYNDVRSWQGANDMCTADGSHLLTLDTPDEYNNVFFKGITQEMWVGATDVDVEGVFRWLVTGESLPLSPPWDVNQPDGGTNEQCLSVLIVTSSSAAKKGRRSLRSTTTIWLKDEICGRLLAFICEL